MQTRPSNTDGGAGSLSHGRGDGTTSSTPAIGDQLASAATEIAGEVKDEASNLAQRAGDAAKEKLEAGKDSAAEQVEAVADALKKTAEGAGDQAWISDLATQGAQELTSLAETLRSNDLEGILGKLSDLARRQPALFFGAAVVAGFAGARLGKAAISAPANDPTPQTGRTGYGSQ